MANCYHCGSSLEAYLVSKPGRQDSCPKCHRDIRCCRNCEFYDSSSHWECREEVSEHVLDKEKATFCDFYKLSSLNKTVLGTGKSDLLSAAEALFKKK